MNQSMNGVNFRFDKKCSDPFIFVRIDFVIIPMNLVLNLFPAFKCLSTQSIENIQKKDKGKGGKF